jgi:hypothetical protein
MNQQGKLELVAIDEIPNVAGGVFKAYHFQRPSDPNSTYVLIWCTRRQADLLLPAPADQLVVMRPFGTRLPLARAGKKTRLTIGDRCYLHLKGMTPEQASQLLVASELIDG